MEPWNDKCILHMDLDAFFASVEQLDHPEYRRKPVIVGGKPGDRRSVVSTASYEARRFGVHSAMPTAKAFQLCPGGIFLYPRIARYHEKSEEVMAVFRNFSPNILQISVDEAFLDLSGTERLFGNPSETARRIKTAVKEKTGLTISVGLAANRYIAKIASGFSKPDGFYEVLPGNEEKFMLSLPLEKVWGIGTKTLDRLYKAGFNTTRDIHERSLQLLVSLFGNATGAFLYNAVRGGEVESFEESKTHSLSSETTFEFDLTDRYAIGTALMELSHTVQFRMLREQLNSRTIMLKIRYEDFTTVTIRETVQKYITSTDDLYNRASALFDKKYEQGRGIRLLGLGLQNIEKSTGQQTFFDFEESKKGKVEKAILELEKKDPTIHISKARLFDTTKLIVFTGLLISFFCLLTVSPDALYAEDMNVLNSSGAGSIVFDESALTPANNSPASLFQYTIHDQNIEFLADGYWESVIKSTAEASFGFGTPFALSPGTPVFSQKVDLSLWFMVNRTWYFEADFADGFEKNTVAAGYRGEGIVKEARIANRGITFPSTYSTDKVNRGIGGGNNQAPGISAHLSDDTGQKWYGDFAFRYDMLESHDKTYYGKNSVSDNDIEPSAWLTGQLYVLPDKDITADVTGVYVESADGSYTDLQGRTYKKLSASEYSILPARCQIIISKDAAAGKKNGTVPAVALQFGSTSSAVIKNALGTYGTKKNPGSAGSFLGKIQRFFGSNSENDDAVKVPNVASFSYGGTNSPENTYTSGTHSVPDPAGTRTDGFFTYIGGTSGTEVLLIQHPAGFSPFAGAWRYDGGTAAADDVAVVSSSTGTESSVYSAIISDDITLVSTDFFSDSHTYVDIYDASVSAGSQNAAVKPEVRYPFAASFPGYYLGYTDSSDLAIRLRSYTAVTRFDIGTDAVAGTVRVYKNGVIDSAAKYDSESGTVTLSSSVSNSDRIYITWYEDSSSTDSGAITAAAGFAYNFTPELSSDIALSTRWSYNSEKKYADSSSSAPGFATLAAGIKYKTETAEVSNTSAVTLESDNVTGYYRILGMNDSVPDTVYLTESAGVDLPDDFVPSLNNRPGDTTTLLPSLSDTYNGSVTAEDGTTDSSISGYKIPVSWNFSRYLNTTDTAWAATAIDLKSSGADLASGTRFSIALKADDTSVTGYDVYLQLGVDAEDDFSVEDTGSVPTWKISDSGATDVKAAFTPSKSGWQTVTVLLKDEDRARFTSNYDARIIIVMKTGTEITTTNNAGTVYAGPFEITTEGVFTSQADTLSVTTEQCTDSLTGVSRFNTSTNYVEKVSWKNTGTVASQYGDDLDITLTRYFSEVDITPYTEINMYFRYTASVYDTPEEENNAAFTFILDREATGITENGKTAVKAIIQQNAFKNYLSSTAQWHKLTINRLDNTVSIDGTKLSSSYYTLAVNTDYVPVRMKMIISTAVDGKAYTSGEFCFDELYLSGTSPHYILENTASASWEKKGTLLSIGTFPLFEDLSVNGTGSAAATIQTDHTQPESNSFAGNTGASITFATIALAGDLGHTADSDSFLSNAGHKVSTTEAVLGVFSASEEYRFDRIEETIGKNNSVSINLNRIFIPLVLSGNTSATANSWAITQKSDSSAIFTAGNSDAGYILKTKAAVSQKLLPSSSDVDRIPTHSYQQGWKDGTETAFSTGKANASLRTVSGEIDNIFHVPVAGLVPEVDFLADGTYKSSTSVLFTDSATIKTVFPFTTGSSQITLGWSKESGGVQENTKGGCYSHDIEEISDSLASRPWFFKALPFYDMFSPYLASTVLADTSMTTDSAESLYYTTTYSAEWKRPVYGTIRDAWIPASMALTAARDIRTSATVSDIYQIKITAGYTAFNIFGSESQLHLFSWFRQDEYTGYVSTTLKIPREDADDMTRLYTGYLLANFYITDTDTLKTGSELSFETADDWSTKFTIVWKRRGHMSPLLGAVILFKPDFDDSHIILTRTDSFNCTFSEATSSSTTNSKVIKKQAFELAHTLDMQITKNLTVTSSVSETYSCTWDTSILLTASASIGAKIQF